MAFRASKKRYKRVEPVAKGDPLNYSAAIRDWYSKALKEFIKEMAADYRSGVDKLYDAPGVKSHFAQDARVPVKRIESFFKSMAEKWANMWADKFASRMAKSFAIKIDKHSFSSVKKSLQAIGVEEPKGMSKDTYSSMMEMYVRENVALIKSIPTEFHSKIERAVWNSLTSPEGTEQGAYGIHGAIQDLMGKSFERAEFIARDQTAKLNSALNNARMEAAGVNKFEWLHSSAGKKPRQCHVDWNGRIFSTIGGPTDLYEVMPDGTLVKYEAGRDGARQGDIAKPGHAPNCRCRARPVLDL